MQIKKSMTVKVKKTAINCPRGSEFLTLADQLTPGTLVPVPIKFSFNENLGFYEAFADDINPTNVIGRIEKIFDDSMNELASSELENLLFGYEMRVSGKEGTNIILMNLDEMMPDGAVDAGTENRSSEIEKERVRILQNNLCPEDILDENIEIMKKNGVAEYLILKALSGYKLYKKPAHMPKTCYVDASDPTRGETLFSECLRNAIDGFPIVYEGDKSVGKNVCAETIARVLNMPLFLVSFSKGMGKDEVFGSKSTDNSSAAKLNLDSAFAYVINKNLGGKASEETLKLAAEFELNKAKSASVAIVQEVSEFVEWLQTGGVMVFNEMNMAEANFFSSFTNQLTDNTGFVNCPGVGRVPIDPNCVLIGGQNAGYKGVQEQNDATMSRMGCIKFPYPENIKNILSAALKGRLDKKYINEVDSFYKILLANVKTGSVSNSCLNIRGFIRALDSVALNGCRIKLARQIEIHVINTCPEKDAPSIKTIMLESISL